MYRLSDYDYELPPELIAQTPVPRGCSRLLVLDRRDGSIRERSFADLIEYTSPGDVLVVNDTRVTARRLRGHGPRGKPVEAFLLRPWGDDGWEALVYPGRLLKPGTCLTLDVPDGRDVEAVVWSRTAEGGRVLRFRDMRTRDGLACAGRIPLPPYITEPLDDEERYQTVYARYGGSAAAPTAGLHFTEELLHALRQRGVALATITLHVGVDTFRPVHEDDPSKHVMHGEWFSIGEDAASAINSREGRVLAVGTTVVRALETVADGTGRVQPASGITRLFIRPPYEFRAVDALLTNFHLPRSTLLMLVCAFAGYESIMTAYRYAVERRFRFYSFGDAMLIV